ncbi:uncharacterized protein KRP23_7017 [Phytophthora ramorum]|uniref:uncharacterized protein n=1 Tax=Phytophthora ramorum TaxID=164328 RepID=UPI0030A9A444|nr:hypothetical protein KRP23_7017 [Phytophthora ramorum]
MFVFPAMQSNECAGHSMGVDGSIVDMTDDVMVDAEGAADQAGVAVPIENERGGRGARGERGARGGRGGRAAQRAARATGTRNAELVRVAVIMVTRLEQWL